MNKQTETHTHTQIKQANTFSQNRIKIIEWKVSSTGNISPSVYVQPNFRDVGNKT